VAFFTFQSGVFADQSELGPAVIEMAADACHDQLKSAGVVARRTGLIPESGTVRTLVAIVAIIMLEFHKAGLAVVAGSVALDAIDLRVRAGQRVAGFGMIESGFCVLPIYGRMALGAVGTELALVVVLVAVEAIAIESEKRLAHIHQFDPAALVGNHFLRGVTLVAGLLRVVPDQRPTGTRVIKLLLGWLPLDELHIGPVVLGMAGAAGLAAVGLANNAGVEAASGSDAGGDLLMTIKTLELWRAAAELMTGSTFECAAQRRVVLG